MLRLFCKTAAIVVLLQGCADDDDRPATLEYISQTILKPSCGTVNCHSSLGFTKDYAFDSVAQTRKSLDSLVVPGDSSSSLLMLVIKREVEPMPPNDTMPDADVELIRKWIDAGAPGL